MSDEKTATDVLQVQWATKERNLEERLRYLLEQLAKETKRAQKTMSEDCIPTVSFVEAHAKELVETRLRLDVARDTLQAISGARAYEKI